MLRAITLVTLAILASSLLRAQPILSVWPDLEQSPDRQVSSAKKLIDPCEIPRNAVAAGQILLFDLDPQNAFRQNTLVSNANTPYGMVSLLGDTLRYEANAGVDQQGDTLQIRSCVDLAGENCSERDLIILIGRPGTSRDSMLTIAGGELLNVVLATPQGGIVCGDIVDIGNYDYREYRELRFIDPAVPSGNLRYQSARASGLDRFQVVLCNEFATCDTTNLSFTIQGARATLPFFDDFSYAGPRPDPALWLEDDTYINDDYGRRPPSYGVATFDGVTSGGADYGVGFADIDRLTTVPIDLSGLTNRKLFLKYYLQLGGFGQAPEQGDRFLTQFRLDDGSWRTVASSSGSRTSSPDSTFQFFSVAIDSAEYFHPDFQVRFQMRGNAAGSFDIWNLDYVRIEEALDSSRTFRDIALAQRPPSPLAPYTQVPYSQFANRPSLLRDRLPIAVFNHFDAANNVSSSQVLVEDAFGIELLAAGLLTGQQFNLPRGYSTFLNTIPSAPLASYRNAAANLSAESARKLTLKYELGIDQDQIRLPGVLRNDTATKSTIIEDLFAYDDGTAELGLANTRAGDRIVLKYESFVTDTLRGLQFAFPNFQAEDATRQLINLQVYIGALGDKSRRPDYEQIFVRPFFPSSSRDTLQAYTTYRLEDDAGQPVELIIPVGSFYVGWQQAIDAATPIQVGVDVNTNSQAEVFTEYGSGWIRVVDVIRRFRGSLMIRPIFSDEVPLNSNNLLEVPKHALTLAPNPSGGTVQVRWEATELPGAQYQLYDLAGRSISQGQIEQELHFDVQPGVYIFRVRDASGAAIAVERLVIH